VAALRPLISVVALLASSSFLAAATLTTYPFIPYPQGTNPQGPLLIASDGNIYGTTVGGGAFGYGSVFKVTPDGLFTTLFNFNNTDGASPYCGLFQGSDGNFYGTTEAGGSSNDGTVFQLTPAGKLTTLVNFNGTNGNNPYAGVVQGGDGNFYGTTYGGGAFSVGTAFEVTPGGTLTTVIEFNGANGAGPRGGLTLGSDGNLYGTTIDGGSGANAGSGTLFEIASNGTVTTTLANFSQGTGNPLPGTLAQASDGTFYGTTNTGILFAFTTAGTFTTVSLNGVNGIPYSQLVKGSDGNFYGISGSVDDSALGTVFKTTTTGIVTNVATLNTQPTVPSAVALVQDSQGNLYGTASGTVFYVNPSDIVTTLFNFNNAAGVGPAGGIIQATDGNFYGTTTFGAYFGDPYSTGTVFKMTLGSLPTTLANLTGTIGSTPEAPLCQGTDGNLYGTTWDGGGSNYGTVFKVTTGGTLSTLAQFNYSNGAFPYAGLVQGKDGNFYGTTSVGGNGTGGNGTVFSVTPTGTRTTLVQFNGTNGGTPLASLILGSDGNFYGTTSQGGAGWGTVFQVTPTGTLTTLSLFLDYGSYPDGPLLQGNDGNYYGTTQLGGLNGNGSSTSGTLFKVTSTGTTTTLGYFGQEVSGIHPQGSLVQDSDGNFFGSTASGGPDNAGTLFRYNKDDGLKTLINFNNNNGADPGSLIIATDGNIYGTTDAGGSANSGTVFRLETSATKNITFDSSSGVPIVVPAYTISGSSLNLALGYEPSPGDILTAVQSTGGLPITGNFTNLSDGGTIAAIYNCIAYTFVASYSGGSGNDLTLSLLSNTFSEWAGTYKFAGGIADPPGSDGVPNLLKYFDDIDPSTPMAATDFAALPSVELDTTTNPGTEYLALTYRQNALTTGVTVTLQTSPDLQTWTNVPQPDVDQQVGTDSTTGDPIMELGVAISPGTARQFIRLNVSSP